MLLAGPLIGAFIGYWLDSKLGTKPYLLIGFLILGFVSAGREVYKLIKQISDDDKDTDDKSQS
jgi:ATP synthase protein I